MTIHLERKSYGKYPMKQRIRLTIEIYHLNQAIIKNAYLRDKYKNDNGFAARIGLPVIDIELRFKRR